MIKLTAVGFEIAPPVIAQIEKNIEEDEKSKQHDITQKAVRNAVISLFDKIWAKRICRVDRLQFLDEITQQLMKRSGPQFIETLFQLGNAILPMNRVDALVTKFGRDIRAAIAAKRASTISND